MTDLKFYINRWLDERKSRSRTKLAKLSKASYSSVRRLSEGSGTPSPANLVSIGEIVCTKNEMKLLLTSIYPELKKHIHFEEKHDLPVNEDIHEALQDRAMTLTIGLITCNSTHDEIILNLGNQGKMAIDSLKEKELIVEDGEGYSLTERIKSIDNTNDETVKLHTGFLLDEYDTSLEKKRSIISYGMHSFNDETIEELAKEFRALESKINAYGKDPDRNGNRKWFYSSFSNTFQNEEKK